MFHVEKGENLNYKQNLSKGVEQDNEWTRTLMQNKLTNTPDNQAENN